MRPLYKESDFEPPPSQSEPGPSTSTKTAAKLTIAAALLTLTVWLFIHFSGSDDAGFQKIQAQERQYQEELSKRFPDPPQPQPAAFRSSIHVVH